MADADEDKLAPEPISTPRPSAVDAAIEQWFSDSFRGGPVARNTECWNIVHAAKDDLKQRLAKL